MRVSALLVVGCFDSTSQDPQRHQDRGPDHGPSGLIIAGVHLQNKSCHGDTGHRFCY